MFKDKPRSKSPAKSWHIKAQNCPFCQADSSPEWKKTEELQRFISERGRILGSERTGLCAKHQRHMTRAVKRNRHLGLLPFVVEAR